MKFSGYLTIAAVFLSAPALAQSYSIGQRVEAYNSVTGKWESGTITRLDGGRYMLHSDTTGIIDWDVGAAQLRAPTGTPPLPGDTQVPNIGVNSPASGGASGFTSGNLPANASPTPLPGAPPINGSASGNASGGANGSAGAAGGVSGGAAAGQ